MGLLLIVLIFLVGLILIFGGNKKKPAPRPMTLPEYASTNAKVVFTTDGTINGEDIHRAIRITVDNNSRNLDIIQGYSGRIIDNKSQANSEAAYSIFLKALYNNGFTTPLKGAKEGLDYSSICPLQNRYSFSLERNNATISKLWTSDCGSATGNFGGNFDTIQSLFVDQITNYEQLTADVQLSQ